MRKIAIYARVSTDRQHEANQLHALRQVATGIGLDVVEFADVISGSTESRPAFDDMMARARAGEFATVLTWQVSRLGRDTGHAHATRKELKRLGVRIVAHGDGIDTDRDDSVLMFGLRALVAEVERENISKNTKLALARARDAGITLGRPRKRVHLRPGESIRKAAKRLRVSEMTIVRRRREAKQTDATM